MISDFEQILSDSCKGMKRSAIRELLKLTAKPEIISYAGGLPSPDSFPVEELKKIVAEMMETEAASALQYGSTEGDMKLREALVKYYNENENLNITVDNLIITTASQQALDLVAKIFINRGDKVIVGLPSYLGGLSAFNAYGAKMTGVSLDDKGMRADELEKTLAEMKAKGEKPKFIYIIPDFQNPAGITMPLERRKEIIDIAHKYDVLILEDSPYRELRFEGEPQDMLYKTDGTGHVITLGTFSKIFAPGFRIGWVIAHPKVVDKIVMAKQGTDLCTPPFTQRIAARYVESGIMSEKIKDIIELYREKKDIMLDTLEKEMPEVVKWTVPEGGLFLFITLPDYMDAEALFKVAIEENVAFVMGTSFYCNGKGRNTMRLNFSYASKENNRIGIERLAKVIKSQMK
ncbi:MAG: aminotransferase [Candidatus Cloacimonadota bacterium]|nr:MAG: aminotransferase [Candidatus Cloacimonadota bacterium]